MPKLHAILIGVSDYASPRSGAAPKPFLAGSLDGPARTVAALADWLRQHSDELAAPLGTLRLLASPSPGEAGLATLAGCPPATRDEVVKALRDWRADAAQGQDDVALFYFAGHGLQRSRNDTVMLLHDLNQGDTLLDRAVALGDVTGGMGSTGLLPDLARTQVFFADCCRSNVPALVGYELAPTAQVFDIQANVAEDRTAPVFLAANGGRETFTDPGGYTYFGADLLACLDGAGSDKRRINGRPSWVVTAATLADNMAQLAMAYNKTAPAGFRRSLVSTLAGDDPTLRVLPGPPKVRCAIRPTPAALASLAELRFGPKASPPPVQFSPKFEPLASLHLEPGLYLLGATVMDSTGSGAPTRRDLPDEDVEVMPPFLVLDYQPPA